MCGGCASAALKVSSRNVTPSPSVPPTSPELAAFHGLPFIMSANSASRTQTTLPSCSRPSHGPVEKRLLVFGQLARASPADARRRGRTRPAPCGRAADRRDRRGPSCCLRRSSTSRALHESAGRHPEVVPHQHHTLHSSAVAVPQRLHQLRVLLARLACSHCSNWSSTTRTFLPRGIHRPSRSDSNTSGKDDLRGNSGTRLAQPLQQPDFRVGGRGLDVDRQHVRRQPGSRPAFTSDDLPQPLGP